MSAKNRVIVYNDELVQKYDPIYQNPVPNSPLDYRAHLYAPKKHFLGRYYDTYNFNIIVMWTMTLFLFITLYLDALKNLIEKTPNLFKKKS